MQTEIRRHINSIPPQHALPRQSTHHRSAPSPNTPLVVTSHPQVSDFRYNITERSSIDAMSSLVTQNAPSGETSSESKDVALQSHVIGSPRGGRTIHPPRSGGTTSDARGGHDVYVILWQETVLSSRLQAFERRANPPAEPQRRNQQVCRGEKDVADESRQ